MTSTELFVEGVAISTRGEQLFFSNTTRSSLNDLLLLCHSEANTDAFDAHAGNRAALSGEALGLDDVSFICQCDNNGSPSWHLNQKWYTCQYSIIYKSHWSWPVHVCIANKTANLFYLLILLFEWKAMVSFNTVFNFPSSRKLSIIATVEENKWRPQRGCVSDWAAGGWSAVCRRSSPQREEEKKIFGEQSRQHLTVEATRAFFRCQKRSVTVRRLIISFWTCSLHHISIAILLSNTTNHTVAPLILF